MHNKDQKVAIIGAGLAGLSAATSLAETGLQVTLFEQDNLGGRLGGSGATDMGAQYFTVRHPAFRQATRDWQQRGWVAEWSPRLYHYDHAHGLRPSTDDIQRLVGIPDMAMLAAHLLGTSPICNTQIRQLQRSADEQWLLQADDGSVHGPFAGLILATAPAAAATLLQDAAPHLQQDVARVRMRPCWSLALRFARPLDTALDACFVRDGPLDWLARNNSKPQRAADERWVVQSTASWAEEQQHASPEQVVATLQQAMGEVLGMPLPQAEQVELHYWPQARPAEELKWGALAAPKLGLYVCGDWCLGGRIENAWLSGRQAARALLDK